MIVILIVGFYYSRTIHLFGKSTASVNASQDSVSINDASGKNQYVPLQSEVYTNSIFGYSVNPPDELQALIEEKNSIQTLHLQGRGSDKDFEIQVRPIRSVDEMLKLHAYVKSHTAGEVYQPEPDGPWWENRGKFLVDEQMKDGSYLLQWEDTSFGNIHQDELSRDIKTSVRYLDNRYVEISASWNTHAETDAKQRYRAMYLETVRSFHFDTYNNEKYQALFLTHLDPGSSQRLGNLSYKIPDTGTFCIQEKSVSFVFYSVEILHGWCNLLESSGRIAELDTDISKSIVKAFDQEYFPEGYQQYDNSKSSIEDFDDVDRTAINGHEALRWTVTSAQNNEQKYIENYMIIKGAQKYYGVTCFSWDENDARMCSEVINAIHVYE